LPNRNYVNGVRWENEVKKAFEDAGWFVIRSAGSRGLFDLAVFGNGNFLLIQCKLKRKPTEGEEDAMRDMARFCRAEYAYLVKSEEYAQQFIMNIKKCTEMIKEDLMG